MIEIISVLLFLGTLTLIAAMIFLDLSKYKFHFFVGIVVMGVAIYSYGLSFNGETLNGIDLVLKAFGNTTAILRGIFRTADISNRINNDLLFLMSAYAIHVIGFGYTYILIFAIFFKNLGLKMRFSLQSRKPHFLILGDDEKLTYLLRAYEKDMQKTTSSKGHRGMNIAVPKTFLAAKELNTKYRFHPGVSTFDVGNQSIEVLLGKGHNHDVVLVSLLSKDRDVMALVEKLNRHYQQHPTSQLKTYILYEDKQHLPVYESFSQEKHKIRFFSYHQLIAQQLILEYPLTSFLPRELMDTEKATLDDVTIQYHLLGFGPTNLEIYRHLFVTNQFPPRASKFFGKEITNYTKPTIEYNIYRDPTDSLISIPTFMNPIQSKKDYLPHPPISVSIEEIMTSFHDGSFVSQLEKHLKKSHPYHVIIIAFDDDVVNLRVLQQVLAYLIEKRIYQYHLFVQMTNRDYVQTSQLFKHKNVIAFGFGDYGYSLNQITNPIFTKIASQIQSTLNPSVPFESLVGEEKENLLYEAISLRFKLNLMGLDLAVQPKGMTEVNFMKRYDVDEQATFHRSHPRAKNDADLNRYKPVAKKLRNLLARQEHLRWTANQMTKGYIPMSMEEMLTTKNYVDHQVKKDARLTSFEGLFDLHDYLVHNLSFAFSDADVIYPFFHTMDHLYDILKNTPFQVVDKIDEKNNQTVELTILNTKSVTSNIK
jgi:hypothetical protein